ncbi:MAG: glutamine synthetase [Pyrinomonadaceae bacterium]
MNIRFHGFGWRLAPPHLPIAELSEGSFENGFGFDASSLRGWAMIHESDMLLIPDPSRFWIDPFMKEPTLCLIADVVEPITREGYGLDPRSGG